MFGIKVVDLSLRELKPFGKELLESHPRPFFSSCISHFLSREQRPKTRFYAYFAFGFGEKQSQSLWSELFRTPSKAMMSLQVEEHRKSSRCNRRRHSDEHFWLENSVCTVSWLKMQGYGLDMPRASHFRSLEGLPFQGPCGSHGKGLREAGAERVEGVPHGHLTQVASSRSMPRNASSAKALMYF